MDNIPGIHPLITAVATTLRRYDMVTHGDRIVVGVSGGPDSIALLHCLVALRDEWAFTLIVGHLNHGLRKDSAGQEADFVKRVAGDLGLAYKTDTQDVKRFCREYGRSLEEGAREVRYRFYGAVAREVDARRVALGHQADDNAESIMMHLLRGTGPKGLTGIPPTRDGWIIRPLIDVSRKTIIQFLRENGLSYVEDASNRDPRYLRNRIRHELFPMLHASYGFQAVPVLTRLAETLREEEAFWDGRVARAFRHALVGREATRIVLSIKHLKALPPALLRRSIRYAVGELKGDVRGLEQKHVALVSQFLNRTCPVGRLNLPRGMTVSCDGNKVTFSLGDQEGIADFAYRIRGLGQTVIEELGLSIDASICAPREVAYRLESFPASVACFDAQAVSFPLIVRNVRPGDRFIPLGMAGSQKVKDFFINKKVPWLQRQRTPLIWSGEMLIWVAGHRIHDAAKVKTDTRRVLKLELIDRDIKD